MATSLKKCYASPPSKGMKVKPVPAPLSRWQFLYKNPDSEKEKNLSSAIILPILKEGLRDAKERDSDLLKLYRKLPNDLRERLIETIEDEEDIADSKRIIAEIRKRKTKTISWEAIKAKNGI